MSKKPGTLKQFKSDCINIYNYVSELCSINKSYIVLNIAEIPLSVMMSLLASVLPAVIVRDLEEKTTPMGFFTDLTILLGGLFIIRILMILNTFAEKKAAYAISIRKKEGIIKRTLETRYSNIENAAFQSEFYNAEGKMEPDGVLVSGGMKKIVSFITALLGMAVYLGLMKNMPILIIILIISGTVLAFAVSINCNKWEAANRHKWMDIDNRTAYISRHCADFDRAKDVAMFNMVPWFSTHYSTELKQRLKLTLRMQLNYWIESCMWAFAHVIWELPAYILLIMMVARGTLGIYEFTLYMGLLSGFAVWVRQIGNELKELNSFSSHISDAERFEKRITPAGEGEQTFQTGNISPVIEFKNVCFKYEKQTDNIISDLSLKIEPGEKIAIVGENGAGKSTLIKLLCGFYTAESGEILINGKNTGVYGNNIFNWFTGVFQDKSFYPFELGKNISMSENADKSTLEDVIRQCGMSEEIHKLPRGLDSHYFSDSSEDGIELSGGEEQKVLLARALYKNAPVVLLDEPTSALDPLMEEEVYRQFNNIIKGRTCVFISHRLASTKFCDRIIYLENGRIAEQGSHNELIAMDGKYAKMFKIQSKYYREDLL